VHLSRKLGNVMTVKKFFDLFPLFSLFWAIHLIPAIIPAGYWVLRRATVRLTAVEPFVLIVPYWVWALLNYSPLKQKGLGNLGLEPLLLGSLVAMLLLGRMILRPNGLRAAQALAFCAISICLALAIYFLVPTWDLPE
jgi:hypothetical protein